LILSKSIPRTIVSSPATRETASLDVIDVIASKLIKSIPTGSAQGVAIDSENNRYFVSVSKPPKMVIVDSTKLDVIGEVPLPGPADLVAYHPETNGVYVCNDDKPEMWIIDPMEKKIVSTINFPGGAWKILASILKTHSCFNA
jgi:DNA-binding beta-propeller fold protein YncE